MQRIAGFTLLEILTTLLLVSVLIITGLPGMEKWITKQRADAEANNILRMLQLTRAHSIQTNARTSFCGSDAAGRCVLKDIRYWQVFVDSNQNKRLDDRELIIQKAEQRFSKKTAMSATGRGPILKYNVDGSARLFGSVYFCLGTADKPLLKRISINRAGRPYIVRHIKITAKLIKKYCA